jgi:hypothetical protein
MHAQTRRFSHVGVMLIGLVLALLVVVPAAKADIYDPADWAPSVWSDKADYAPGERVNLNGAHWTPGESVHIRVNDDTGSSWDREVDVTADETGAIGDEFDLPNWFVAKYRVTATGASGAVATHTFTDSNYYVKNASTTPANVAVSYKIETFSSTDCTGAASVKFNGSLTGPNAAGAQAIDQDAGSVRFTYAGANNGYGFDQWKMDNHAPGQGGATDGAPVAGGGSSSICDAAKNGGTVTYVGFSKLAKQDQTITFPALADRTYGDADVQLNATASSGLPVSYSASGACSVNADRVHITAGGSCTVTASQAGNANFNAATPVSRAFTIAQRPITVTADAKSKTYSDNDPALTYTVTSGSLVSGDSFSGALTRAAGETVAGSPYAIQQGSLTAGGNYALTYVGADLAITKKGVTVAGAAAQNKTYDGTKAATVDFSNASLQGVVGGDAVSIDHSGSQAEFDNPNVGTDKPVTVTGITLTGAAAANYSLAQPSGLKANIAERAITVSADAKSKTYGDNDPELTYTITSGSLASGDSFSGALTRAAGESVAGGPYPIQQGTLTAGGNYALTFVGADLAITKKVITGSFKAADKVYDGNRNADITDRTLDGVIGQDKVSLTGGTAQFDTKDVGVDKDVTGADFALDGADEGNYTLASVADAKASINAKDLTGHFTPADKVYDGNRNAEITGRTLDGVVGNEDVTLTGGFAHFDTKDVGAAKAVTGAGFALDGADKGNYTLGSVATAEASVTPKDVTGSFTAADKVYDGNRDAAISGRSLSETIPGDDVSLAGGSAVFDTEDVGVDKDVTGTGFELAGDDKGNYTLESTTLGAKAKITPKSVTGSFTAADKVYDGNRDAQITGRSVDGVVDGDAVSLTGGTATFANADVGQNKTVTGTGFELAGSDAGNYRLASSTLTTTASITYRWDGFLQPINDTAHQTGVNQSKFKLGQTIPAKFVIKNAFGTVVKQASNPTFTRSAKLGTCDVNAAVDPLPDTLAPDNGASYTWDGSQYHYNWSTKGLSAGEYRIFANLADGTKPYVDICLAK